MKDVETIALLARAYAGELETVQNYLANSVWLDGLGAQEVSESLAEEMTEELGHAQKLAHRLKQLGACPPGSLKLERKQKSLQPPAESTDVLSVVQGVLDAENEAIAYYRQIIKASEGKDHVTQDLAVKLQADEEEHRCLFEGFLKSLKKENPRAENQMRAGSSRGAPVGGRKNHASKANRVQTTRPTNWRRL